MQYMTAAFNDNNINTFTYTRVKNEPSKTVDPVIVLWNKMTVLENEYLNLEDEADKIYFQLPEHFRDSYCKVQYGHYTNSKGHKEPLFATSVEELDEKMESQIDGKIKTFGRDSAKSLLEFKESLKLELLDKIAIAKTGQDAAGYAVRKEKVDGLKAKYNNLLEKFLRTKATTMQGVMCQLNYLNDYYSLDIVDEQDLQPNELLWRTMKASLENIVYK